MHAKIFGDITLLQSFFEMGTQQTFVAPYVGTPLVLSSTQLDVFQGYQHEENS
ncbi:hypothetical protein GCM10007094_36650 [Pseudovibrio japonicus]|uniref:Uncharacterized protein n=1 Tax=Pseudovibrio japonicus TaxID=366534 RepID=A0ABQ3EKA2_9HYPH|nr:hypothetical protein GCM10007094_36650 [Pseudovibrio japonicus]